MDVRSALKRQYHAALAMLKQPIERCPEELWTNPNYPTHFWNVAYHTLFYTHFYLQPHQAAFHRWEKHRDHYQDTSSPRIGEPYTRAEVLEYWALCDAAIDAGVDQLDLAANESGFPWYQMPKLDHQLVNIRHIQHHAAELADRLRSAAGIECDWVGGGGVDVRVGGTTKDTKHTKNGKGAKGKKKAGKKNA
ncbi:MAG: DinB family protein [Planctomycetota bacterium]|nr:DinB family protein [Planctomycetota bacterium]